MMIFAEANWTDPLPHVNAFLNLTATVLLVLGVMLIKRGKQFEKAHKITMISCFAVSSVFLACYLVRHFEVPSKEFPKDDYPNVKYGYWFLLATHVILAISVPFLAITTIVLGYKDNRKAHKKWAKITFPIWLYVSVTGVIVYLMLYWFFPPLEG